MALVVSWPQPLMSWAERPTRGANPDLRALLVTRSRNRRPLCGANHKSDAERCRLCGQSLAPGALGLNNKQVVQPVRTARGTKGMLLVGIGLVLAVLVIALAFGVVQANSQLRKAKDLVVGEADGWTTQVDERGVFSVDLPGDRRPVTTDYPGADDGKLSGWEAVVGNDTDLVVGWGPRRRRSPTAPSSGVPPCATCASDRPPLGHRQAGDRERLPGRGGRRRRSRPSGSARPAPC